MRYLDPKNDIAFKKVFGEHKNLCISLLNNMLPLKTDEQIETIEYLTPELLPEYAGFKDTIVDVRCTDQKGRQFLVEMQMYWNPNFQDRVVFNASKAYVQQLKAAEMYKKLKPVYSLNFVNEIYDKETNEFYHHYKIANINNTNETIEGLQFVFIELPKFKSSNYTDRKLQSLWLRFLTEIEVQTKEISPELFKNTDVKAAIKQLEVSAFNDAEIEAYERYRDELRKNYFDLEDAKELAKEQGKAEGMEEGEQAKAKKSAIIGLKEGYPIEIISKMTGLSEKEILKLKTND